MPIKRILFLGDVCSSTGRSAIKQNLSGMRSWSKADVVIANAENIAGGYGINCHLVDELFEAGVDLLTTGDHAFDRKDSWDCFKKQPRLLRPMNYPDGAPGSGWTVFEGDGFRLGLINLLGRVFMKPVDCPFSRVEPVVDNLRRETSLIVVDFHAEATAEKQALGWHLDGRVTAVVGTHTHVQTADERVLPGGTAYITDAGMCGAFDSVLGMEKSDSLARLKTGLPFRMHPAKGDPRIQGVVVEADDDTGKALAIERVQTRVDQEQTV